MKKKFIIIGIIATVLIGLIAWLFIESSKPLPGQKIDDEGRGHVPIGESVEYHSNPPTSGKHYEEWTKQGVYMEEKDDRNLVHSLEHGYIIMHYKCLASVTLSGSEGSNNQLDSSPSAQNDTEGECKIRKDQLANIYEEKSKYKLIVVPRGSLETNFALTAWDYLDKFDDFDKNRIVKFIDAHLNMGPEKTME